MRKELDPNEAPPGFIAVAFTRCGDCAFYNKKPTCRAAPCQSDIRLDGRDVMFIPKYPEPAKLLTVLAEALKAHRFDGLFVPGYCACKLDELSPFQCMSGSCRPGVLLADATCDNCTKEAPCAYHIGDPPKLGDPLKVCGQPREETA